MYLDHIPEIHSRFAAYEVDWNQIQQRATARGRDQANIAAYYDRAFGLQERELEARMKQASASSANQRASLNAQMKMEKARLALATRQLEEIGIPELELKKWVSQKNYEIAAAGTRLDYINTYLQARQSPDQYFYAQGYKDIVNKLGGLPFTDQSTEQMSLNAPQGGSPEPQSLAKLVADLGGGTGAGVPQQQAASGGGTPGGGAGPTITGDPRVDAAMGLMQANPPSPYDGLSESDANSLRTIGDLFKKGIDFNQFQRLSPGAQKFAVGGAKQLGYDPQEELWKSARNVYSMGNAAAA